MLCIMGSHEGTEKGKGLFLNDAGGRDPHGASVRGCCTSYNKEAGARLVKRNACPLDIEHALRFTKRALAFIVFRKKLRNTHFRLRQVKN